MSTRAGLLSSRTFYRWAPWVGGAVLAAGVVAVLLVFFRNTADPAPPQIQQRGPAITEPSAGKRVAASREVQAVASRFIKTAVAGRDLATGWRLAHPELKAGFTRREWVAGTLPFPPYPVDLRTPPPFRVDESFERRVELEVVLTPRKGAKEKPQIFFIGLKAVGDGAKKRWLVYYWNARSTAIRPELPT